MLSAIQPSASTQQQRTARCGPVREDPVQAGAPPQAGSSGAGALQAGSPGTGALQVGGRALSRRGLLAAAGLGAGAFAAALAGCAPAIPAGGLRPDGRTRVATYITPGYKDLHPAVETFCTALDDRLGHGHVDLFDSGALLGAEQLVPGMLRGVTDIGFQTSSYVSTSFPILGAAELPFLGGGFEQLRAALAPGSALRELFNRRLAPQGIMSVGSMPTTLEWLFTVDRPVEKPGDLRGLRIRTAGHVEGRTIRALGGSPVALSSAELYEALERGTIDGMVSYLGTVTSRGLHDVLGYATQAHFGAYSVDAYAGTAWFDRLPRANREALAEAGDVYGTEGTAGQLAYYESTDLPALHDSGLQVIELDEAATSAFVDATADVRSWWISTVGDTELAETALRLYQEAR